MMMEAKNSTNHESSKDDMKDWILKAAQGYEVNANHIK
jgi:hypothetical protein